MEVNNIMARLRVAFAYVERLKRTRKFQFMFRFYLVLLAARNLLFVQILESSIYDAGSSCYGFIYRWWMGSIRLFKGFPFIYQVSTQMLSNADITASSSSMLQSQ